MPAWRVACCASAIRRPVYWVQDYHFLTLGAELRQLRVERPIGFFLHTPWAERGTMLAVPHHADLVQATSTASKAYAGAEVTQL